jgi:hypothetical protein
MYVTNRVIPTFSGDIANGTQVTIIADYKDAFGARLLNIKTTGGRVCHGLDAGSITEVEDKGKLPWE